MENPNIVSNLQKKKFQEVIYLLEYIVDKLGKKISNKSKNSFV